MNTLFTIATIMLITSCFLPGLYLVLSIILNSFNYKLNILEKLRNIIPYLSLSLFIISMIIIGIYTFNSI